jgi:hypothetical protein|mmetsp:Transcript_11831/g.29670  ORF Transcript_11831/g.29670 Transcript_11831/m.29670 type:complete len:163 (-) Transcript_11831:242-730(-)
MALGDFWNDTLGNNAAAGPVFLLLCGALLLLVLLTWVVGSHCYTCSQADVTGLTTALTADLESGSPQTASPQRHEQGYATLQSAQPPSARSSEYTEGSLKSRDEDGAPAMEPVRRCVVCKNRPPQVVLLPCGHACACRHCSRKLDTCPICQLEIKATQRFYL